MQPGKTSITLLFNAPTQYVIPLFQRGYVWTLEKQVAPLWSDLADRADDLIKRQEVQNTSAAHLLGVPRKHFLGSLVLTPVVNSFGRVGAYEVIDGQQRTTTLHLLLVAFRDVSKRLGNAVLIQWLENLTRNPGPYNESSDHYKVWPTKAGRDEIAFLNTAGTSDAVCKRYPLKVGKGRKERPLLVQTYLYLYHATFAYLRGVNLEDSISAETDTTYSDYLTHLIRHEELVTELVADKEAIVQRAELLFMAMQDHVQIMTLTLEAEDDPQVIFETLNARGEPLLASDLVRNFIFLEATRKGMAVEDLYGKYWQDFDEQKDAYQKITSNRYWREKERQGRITNPRIDLFFFHYTILQRVAETKVGHVFQNYKDWWQKQPRDLEVELAHIQKVSGWFKEFISPAGYSRTAEFARLIKALDVSTLAPVYLALRDLYEEDSPELLQAISDLESYVVRRAVCGFTTKNYNRIFMRLLEILNVEQPREKALNPTTDNVAPTPPTLLLRSYLQKLGGYSQCWPSDQEFRDAWFSRAVYKEMRVGKVCALLRAIELASHTNKQEILAIPQTLTIEHILPQAWENSGHYPITDMTDPQRIERNRILHTFGNLTLLTQALNSSASNGPFHSIVDPISGEVLEGKRRKIAANSLLKINAYFQNLGETSWDEAAISTRTESLFTQALTVWKRPTTTA
jgi:uncharacterized protein with ParB-like and HNH nuclease domain